MKIAVGCDHRGLALKEEVLQELQKLGVAYEDKGCFSSASVDYPDVARQVAEGVASGAYQHGILICGTGIGMSMAANKVPGVRAALCNDTFSARMAREHNNANVLCLGGTVMGPGPAREIVRAYLSASFQGGRHAVRVAKIEGTDRKRQET
ncbi:MAG: ribose 5-phosphate isomerase B [Chloroflexi bacterium]|nr:ribose 5-phosphate isomerase B [Chloroflexota bacterium]